MVSPMVGVLRWGSSCVCGECLRNLLKFVRCGKSHLLPSRFLRRIGATKPGCDGNCVCRAPGEREGTNLESTSLLLTLGWECGYAAPQAPVSQRPPFFVCPPSKNSSSTRAVKAGRAGPMRKPWRKGRGSCCCSSSPFSSLSAGRRAPIGMALFRFNANT